MTVLLMCQLAGEALSAWLRLPLPGPLVGLLLLLSFLLWRGQVPAELDTASSGLLRYLGFFYVPAGVGIITKLDLLARNWLAVAVSLGVSTLLGLAVTGWLMQRLATPEADLS